MTNNRWADGIAHVMVAMDAGAAHNNQRKELALNDSSDEISYPFGSDVAVGAAREIAAGLVWSRLPLPYAPAHVNTYCLDGSDGICVIETGLDDEATGAAWNQLLSSALRGKRITRVMPTHWHSDHVGYAGRLCAAFNAPLVMTESEYLYSALYRSWSPERARALREPFYRRHGLDGERLEAWLTHGYHYLDLLAPWPDEIERVANEDTLLIAGHQWEIHTLAGHSPEELTLYDRTRRIYICGDQLTPRLAPNLGVWPHDPFGDPLGRYLRSLCHVEQVIDADAIVAPAHEAPYRGLPARVRSLRAYYDRRLRLIEEACRDSPRNATELLPVLWRRAPDPVWIGFMVNETVSYLNHLVKLERVERTEINGIWHFKKD